MRLALDTNAYTAFCKNHQTAVDAIQIADELILPLMVLGELRAGFSVGRRGGENERTLQRFLNSKRVAVKSPNEDTTYLYARLFAYLRKKGAPIPINDLWIAAVALQNEATLLTFDQHFALLPQIPLWE